LYVQSINTAQLIGRQKGVYLGALDVLEELQLILGLPFALLHFLKVEQPISRGEGRDPLRNH